MEEITKRFWNCCTGFHCERSGRQESRQNMRKWGADDEENGGIKTAMTGKRETMNPMAREPEGNGTEHAGICDYGE